MSTLHIVILQGLLLCQGKTCKYTIGGYQVIKKWLSYREAKILGRALTKEEVREVRDMARRIAAIVLLEPALDANYRAVKEHAFAWKGNNPAASE